MTDLPTTSASPQSCPPTGNRNSTANAAESSIAIPSALPFIQSSGSPALSLSALSTTYNGVAPTEWPSPSVSNRPQTTQDGMDAVYEMRNQLNEITFYIDSMIHQITKQAHEIGELKSEKQVLRRACRILEEENLEALTELACLRARMGIVKGEREEAGEDRGVDVSVGRERTRVL